MPARTITVNDRMQKGYRYRVTAPVGRGFDPEFKPELSPQENRAISSVGDASGKRFSIGRTTAERFDPGAPPLPPIAEKFCNENQR
jgi:hypothetical protein